MSAPTHTRAPIGGQHDALAARPVDRPAEKPKRGKRLQSFDDPVWNKNTTAAFLALDVRSIERFMRDDPSFPIPLRVNGHARWYATEIQAWLEKTRQLSA